MQPEQAFSRLLQIMDDLRVKCPWDRKQTIQSLRQLTIEELYELTDAITDQDYKGIREELGDLLLHIVFYAKIGSEQQQFTITDVITGVCDKLVARHPHIYGDVKVNNEEDVKQNWEKLKLKEGKDSVLSGVPASLPALVKSMRLQEKAKQVGFEWENRDQVWDKVKEEMEELKEAIAAGDPDEMEAEFGDLLFSLVNYSRFMKIDSENALERTNKKFIRRFRAMEGMAAAEGRRLDEMSLPEMDGLWNKVKEGE
ncbi:nucleoside triphosphate pyrophosphohydrolase [Chitinophaga sp. XS-30]|uniref:nucleoside triphosphate pyrophosphohydrolase n=1 Tax=Chitinophaga sp. XS-30 TaxID=2604421 RepID=UPI0011DE2F2F|nr:nucleoside triphosphate pyrophosphohydrolase [Chitinophaga sp. XS-30]QEH41669.1 nucleoside triphosphate pyrophosphohydrolase [Chitinophaga sp. XS-30]